MVLYEIYSTKQLHKKSMRNDGKNFVQKFWILAFQDNNLCIPAKHSMHLFCVVHFFGVRLLVHYR